MRHAGEVLSRTASSSTSGTLPSTATPTLSTSTSATSARRSTGPSGARRSRPSAAAAIGCATQRPANTPAPTMRPPARRSSRAGAGLSIQTRLTIVSALLMAIVIGLLGLFLYLRLEADLKAALDDRLRDHAAAVASLPAPGERPRRGARSVDPGDTFVQLVDADGTVDRRARRRSAGRAARPPTPSRASPRSQFFDAAVPDQRGARAGSVAGGAAPRRRGRHRRHRRQRTSRRHSPALAACSLIGAPIADRACQCGRLVCRRGRTAASRTTADRGRGRFGVRARPPVPVPATGDELARLAESLNRMLARLEEAAERERRFVATRPTSSGRHLRT